MTALENLYTRRSIRKYKPEQITDEALEQVLKLAGQAIKPRLPATPT